MIKSTSLVERGGRGKTSIAYELAKRVVEDSSTGFDFVRWFTAKKQHFLALKDTYRVQEDVDFSDVTSLLKCICLEVGQANPESIDDYTFNELRSEAREALSTYPSLLIVDDVDSAVADEQKKIIETCMWASAGTESKILLTVRQDWGGYSSNLVTALPGLQGDEYRELCKKLARDFGKKEISDSQIRRMSKASDGSPLYTESLFRFWALEGGGIDKIIKSWEGEKGDRVREFTLKRELEQLSVEALKTLYVIAAVSSCSLSELVEYTELDRGLVEECINAIGRLFLIPDARIIESEPTYQVSHSTGEMVRKVCRDKLPDTHQLDIHIKQTTEALLVNRSKRELPEIGRAISQALSLTRQEKFADAELTVNQLLSKTKFRNNPDLLFASARIAYSDPSVSDSECKKKFVEAYNSGQNKLDFFRYWFEVERRDRSTKGALEVAERACDSAPKNLDWKLELARSKFLHSRVLSSFDKKARLLAEAHQTIQECLATRSIAQVHQYLSLSQEIADELWGLADDYGRHDVGFQASLAAIKAGDKRHENYKRAAKSYRKLTSEDQEDVRSLELTFSALLDELVSPSWMNLRREVEAIAFG